MALQDPTPGGEGGRWIQLPGVLRRVTPGHAIASSIATAIGTGAVTAPESMWSLTVIGVVALVTNRGTPPG